MDGAANQFLRRACASIQQYDRDGRATVPLGAWPLILEDLDVPDSGEHADFLKQHLEAAEEGFFTYTPLLQVLGAVPSHRNGSGADVETGPSIDDSQKRPSQDGGYSAVSAPAPPRLDETLPRAPRPQEQEAARQEAPRCPQPPALEELQSQKGCDIASTAFDEDGEDSETFWARRASTIQHFYNKWDCNQLTNEAFARQLQNILGSRVDMGSPDSEVVRLTNQHRFARNLKFAELMAALRRDARSTRNRCGAPGSPSGSYAASLHEPTPSEAPSDVPSYAAGRPTKLSSNGFSILGRKHYVPSETGDDDMSSTRGSIRREPKPRTPAPFASLADLPSKQMLDSRSLPPRSPAPFADEQSAKVPSQRPASQRSTAPFANDFTAKPSSPSGSTVPQSPAPFAKGANFEEGFKASRSAPAAQSFPADFWSRKGPLQNPNNEQSDVASQYGAQSDMMSVADSQREEFTARDKRGHGNILTWGNNSRTITPPKKREGRQLITADDGQMRAHATSGVFPPSPHA